jgi:uncharacterized damage-inducible protein DinB
MHTHNPLDILLAHNHWDTRNTLDAAPRSPASKFHRRFEMGPGSLHDTAAHILGAQQRWTDLLAEREPRPRLEDTPRTVHELLMLLDEIGADLLDTASRHPIDQAITASRAAARPAPSRAAPSSPTSPPTACTTARSA